MVFNRCAGCQKLESTVKRHCSTRTLGFHIFYGLCLIKNNYLPVDTGQKLCFLLQEGIACHQYIKFLQGLDQLLPVPGPPKMHL